jgi:hypothetical protein
MSKSSKVKKMKLKILTTSFLLIFLLIVAFFPSFQCNTAPETAPQYLDASTPSKTTAYITNIPYVWQEINGFCHWACISMALQHLGLPINLYDVFAATGIGFSAVYVTFEDLRMFIPGSNYRQIYQAQYLAMLLGIDYTVMVDNSTEPGQMLTLTLDAWNLDYQLIEGGGEAQQTLCQCLDAGYPMLLWVDPFYLPPSDYDILRNYSIHSSNTGSGHAILAIGYNDTAQIVWIMDPGVGALGDHVAYPSDGRWHYNISYTDLNMAREALGFGAITITLRNPEHNLSQYSYPTFIYQRLLGIHSSYELTGFDPTIVSCGANAFRRLSADLSPGKLANYLLTLGDYKSILQTLYEQGILFEQSLTLQYLSYRSALSRLQTLIPEKDLSLIQYHGQAAFPHFSVLTTNTSLTTFDPTSYHSLIKDTFWGIAESYEQTGNIYESVAQFTENLNIIQAHLNGIAATWEVIGYGLRFLISAPIYYSFMIIFFTGSLIAIIVVSSLIVHRNKRRSQISEYPERT